MEGETRPIKLLFDVSSKGGMDHYGNPPPTTYKNPCPPTRPLHCIDTHSLKGDQPYAEPGDRLDTRQLFALCHSLELRVPPRGCKFCVTNQSMKVLSQMVGHLAKTFVAAVVVTDINVSFRYHAWVIGNLGGRARETYHFVVSAFWRCCNALASLEFYAPCTCPCGNQTPFQLGTASAARPRHPDTQ